MCACAICACVCADMHMSAHPKRPEDIRAFGIELHTVMNCPVWGWGNQTQVVYKCLLPLLPSRQTPAILLGSACPSSRGSAATEKSSLSSLPMPARPRTRAWVVLILLPSLLPPIGDYCPERLVCEDCSVTWPPGKGQNAM